MNFKNVTNAPPKSMSQTEPNPDPEKSLYDYFSQSSVTYICYTPDNNKTNTIMKIVGKTLNVPSNNIGVADDERMMVDILKEKFKSTSMNSDDSSHGFGIVFEEIKNSHVLRYKIKNTINQWQTDELFPILETPGPMNLSNIYLTSGFVALQLAVDKAFIAQGNTEGTNYKLEDYKFSIQSYPYKNYQENPNKIVLKRFLAIFTVLSFLQMCSNTIKTVTEEKKSGIKELMKIMGFTPCMIWIGWILHNIYVHVISIAVITYISCYFGEVHLLNHTNPFLYWIFLIMYVITGIIFCFAISSLINSPLTAMAVGIIMWVLSYFFGDSISSQTKSIQIRTLLMLFPNACLDTAYDAIYSFEFQGSHLTFSTLFDTGHSKSNFSFGFILFMFIVDSLFYGIIAWYMDSVMPGKYGIAKPFNFLCKRSKKKNQTKALKQSVAQRDIRLFETPPNDHQIDISVQSLSKRFGDFYALNGVNLDIYKGYITALLGHTGAGKTTIMSIITGMIELVT